MKIEPPGTLREIQEYLIFWISKLGHIGPLGPDTDRVCYHLYEDVYDEAQHDDRAKAHQALLKAGVSIGRDALEGYPFEIWEPRWPTMKWVDHELPLIFDVMNHFEHGLMGISYEPKGASRGLISAAFRDAWDNADPAFRPPNLEQEDMSKKAALVTFDVELNAAVYQAVQNDRLTFREASERLDAFWPVIHANWPEGPQFRVLGPITRYNEKHEALRVWALSAILASSVDATQK